MSTRFKLPVVALSTLMALAACNDNDSTMAPVVVTPPEPVPVNYTYEVTVSNLTHSQPMSPVALALHNESGFWQLGESASESLEVLAESGDNTNILAESFVLASQSGSGMIMPGMSETVSVTITDTLPMYMSIATMLVNTNDAFTGINGFDLSNLPVGESISTTTRSYDAGTEKNSELSSTIPGPASGGAGEGFNAERDDVDFISMHPGVVTMDDGLTMSVLTQEHRFDNPTLHITIMRVE